MSFSASGVFRGLFSKRFQRGLFLRVGRQSRPEHRRVGRVRRGQDRVDQAAAARDLVCSHAACTAVTDAASAGASRWERLSLLRTPNFARPPCLRVYHLLLFPFRTHSITRDRSHVRRAHEHAQSKRSTGLKQAQPALALVSAGRIGVAKRWLDITQVEHINLLLESFGNAATTRNHNSSRKPATSILGPVASASPSPGCS